MVSLFVPIVGDAAGRRGDSVLIWYWSMTESSRLCFVRCDEWHLLLPQIVR
jgi:hypothetical protein